MTPEERSQPVRLDRERILDAAARVVGDEGMSALTMRRIGAELGADPTAVYRHFRNKRELLTELSDRLFATEPTLDPSDPWQERLRVSLRHSLGRYRTHLDLGLLLAAQPDDLPSLVQIRERAMALLIEAGLELQEAARMEHLLECHVVGCGLFFAVSGWSDGAPVEELASMRRAYAALGDDVAPLSREAATVLFPGPDDMFEQINDIFIAAIERTAAQRKEEVACT
jgi:AcrR family transcriptional regulator